MSHPRVSHQVETNVVTQANRLPVSSRESDPVAPPRAATADRQNRALGRVCRASVHPTAGRIVGGGALVLATHGSVGGYRIPGKGRGTAPHPPGIVPGERAGRGMAKGSFRTTPDTRNVSQKLSGLVRSTRGSRVSCNRQKTLRGSRRPMVTWHRASWPSATGGLAWVSPGFLRRAAGVTFQKLSWFLRSRPPLIRGAVGRPGVSAEKVYSRARMIGSRRICDSLPGRPDRGDQRLCY